MKQQYKYIHFRPVETLPKTGVWACRNNRSGDTLGIVRWYGRFRGYSYFPVPGTVYNLGCLRDIGHFIEQLNAKQRESKGKQ